MGLVRVEVVGGRKIVTPVPEVGEGLVSYYADSTGIRPLRWLGARDGDVVEEDLLNVLAGIDPETGLAVVRSMHGRPAAATQINRVKLEHAGPTVSAPRAADIIGISPRHIRDLLAAAVATVTGEAPGDAEPEAGEPEPHTAHLSATRRVLVDAAASGEIRKNEAGRWEIDKSVLHRIGEARRPRRTVYAYDLTMSVPKDVSLIWARGDERVRQNVLAAVDEATAAGVRYFERHAFAVRVRGERKQARNWLAAEALHLTSRALDPQLHKHIVLINRAEDDAGNLRALDGTLMYLHAKTAAYIAEAELRHQMTARLGVEYGRVLNGVAPIVGVSRELVEEFSKRSTEIAEAVKEIGVDTATARQLAALDTRREKEGGFDFDAVMQWWGEYMDAEGFTVEALADVLGRKHSPGIVSTSQIDDLYRALIRFSGITENEARFDRRTVVQAIAEFGIDRLSGEAVEDIADRFLSLDQIVELRPANSRDASSTEIIRLSDGRAVRIDLGGIYSTRSMLRMERTAMDLYERGRGVGFGVVPVHVLDQVLAEPRFARVVNNPEQLEFVRELVTSGHRTQGAVGRAGSGKTTALEVAVAAWRASGYRVLGSAVGGMQAVVLGEEATGEARTVASVLSRYFDIDDPTIVDEHTVLLVDEASVLSTRDAALLQQAVAEHPGAILRLVGDEQQHTSVAAGGFFRWIVEEHSDDTPQLRTVYRQQGEAMAEVRRAIDEYRKGYINTAFARLAKDGRITEASTPQDAYNLLVCAWYDEVLRRRDDPSRRISAMTAARHLDRATLNELARALLKGDGTLAGPELVVDGVGYQANDLVVAKITDRELRAEGAERDAYVRNGSQGVVAEVYADRLVVDFERWGRVEIPVEYVKREYAPGIRGGLMHAYAQTTYAAQGATMAAGIPLITDASSRESVYVGLTRGQFELDAIVIRYDNLVVSEETDVAPRMKDELSDMQATARALEYDRSERMAFHLDPDAQRVNELATNERLDALEEAVRMLRPTDATAPVSDEWLIYDRALRERQRRVGLQGVTQPDAETVAHLGPRPSERDARNAWDHAAGAIAIYREREHANSAPGAEVCWAIGPKPEGDTESTEYERFAAIISPVDAHPGELLIDWHLLGNDELLPFAEGLLAEVNDRQLRYEVLGRDLEVRDLLMAEALRDGRDAVDIAEDLREAGDRFDAGANFYGAGVAQLAEVLAELEIRGLELPDGAGGRFGPDRDTPDAADDLAPQPARRIEREGPNIEL